MKRIYLMIPLILLSACSAQITVVRPVAESWMSEDLKTFISGFEKTAMSHDDNDIIYYMDEGYVQEQMMMNLGGRKNQFLREIFGGNFQEIEKVHATNVPVPGKPGEYKPVVFDVSFKSGVKKTVRLYIMRLNGQGKTFSLFGAMG